MDIRNVKLLYLKGALFLVCGSLAALAILLEVRSLKLAVLLAIAVWCFARAYYFAFYVVGHYVDPTFRFSGLGSFIQYLTRSKTRRQATTAGPCPRDSDA